jgi:hypothetical protein
MKRNRLLGSMVAAASLLGSTAHADSGWTGYGSVVELQAGTAGRFLFRLSGADNPSRCREQLWFYRDYAGPGVSHLFDALSLALVNDKKVRVYVTGVCDHLGYSEISSVGLVSRAPRD